MNEDKLRIARVAAMQLTDAHLAKELRINYLPGPSAEWKKAVIDEAAERLEKK